MTAIRVSSIDAAQNFILSDVHTESAAEREMAARRLAGHIGVKAFEVAVEPLTDDAMTKRGRSMAVRT